MSVWVIRSRDAAGIRFDYDPALVAAIKTKVPASARSWDAGAKQWTVREPYVDPALTVLARLAAGAVFVHDERARAAARVERSWAELLLHAAPVEMRAPLFRALLKVIHPDVGGSAELTRALIAAYEKARLP